MKLCRIVDRKKQPCPNPSNEEKKCFNCKGFYAKVLKPRSFYCLVPKKQSPKLRFACS